MVRYYLVPFEDDPEKMRYEVQPKYLNALANSGVKMTMRGIEGKELASDGEGNRQWLHHYYILRIVCEDGTDWTQFDNLSDVIRLTRQHIINNRTRLETIGINCTGLTVSTPRKAIERRLFQWLTEEDKDMSQTFAVDGEID